MFSLDYDIRQATLNSESFQESGQRFKADILSGPAINN